MAREQNRRSPGRNRVEPFTPIYREMVEREAFRQLGGAAVKVYIELRRRYNGKNNGQLNGESRSLAACLHLRRSAVKRALLELVAANYLAISQAAIRAQRLARLFAIVEPKCEGVFTRLPRALVGCPAFRSLSGPAAKAYIELRTRLGECDNEIHVGQVRLARDLHIHTRSTRAALAELVDKGFLVRLKRGHFHSRHGTIFAATDRTIAGESAPRNNYMKGEPARSFVSVVNPLCVRGEPKTEETLLLCVRGEPKNPEMGGLSVSVADHYISLPDSSASRGVSTLGVSVSVPEVSAPEVSALPASAVSTDPKTPDTNNQPSEAAILIQTTDPVSFWSRLECINYTAPSSPRGTRRCRHLSAIGDCKHGAPGCGCRITAQRILELAGKSPSEIEVLIGDAPKYADIERFAPALALVDRPLSIVAGPWFAPAQRAQEAVACHG